MYLKEKRKCVEFFMVCRLDFLAGYAESHREYQTADRCAPTGFAVLSLSKRGLFLTQFVI